MIQGIVLANLRYIARIRSLENSYIYCKMEVHSMIVKGINDYYIKGVEIDEI